MKKILLQVQTLVLVGAVFSPGGMWGQPGDIIARRNLNLKGQAKADVQLLAVDGEMTIAETAVVDGDARLPEDPANGGGNGRARHIASTVRISLPAAVSALKGQLRGTSTFEFPLLAAPRPSPGTQTVQVNGADKSNGHFERAKDVLVQDADQAVALPPGAYGRMRAENARVLLGVAGSYGPTRYDFALVELNGRSRIELAGPVIITTGELRALEGVIGREDLPGWLDLRVERGDLALKAGSAIYGSLYAPRSDVVLENGAVAEGWLAGEAVTIERTARFTARHFNWDSAARPEVHPVFSQKAVLIQNRFAGLGARLAGHYSVALSYGDDVPTLTLTGLPGRDTEKVETKDRAIFFDAFRVLLAGSFVEEGRVIMRKAPGKGAREAESLDVRMTAEDFVGHLWAVGGEKIPADSVRKIQASSGLQNFFLLRSLTVAKTAVGDAR